jgi:ubiquinone/menaquinone biosynthesis C-methylase UbiE
MIQRRETTLLEEQKTKESLPNPALTSAKNTPLATWLSEFEEQLARDFRRRTGLDYKETIAHIIEAADPQPGWRVLDAATGTGIIARQFIGRVGEKGVIVAADTAERVKQAELASLSAKVGRKIEWRVLKTDKLPFENDSFDLITCAMAFHRLPAESFLASAHRVLKDGGRLIIADELAPTISSRFQTGLRRLYYRFIKRDKAEADAHFYATEKLLEMLRAAGFRQQTVKVLRQRSPHDRAFSLIKAVK